MTVPQSQLSLLHRADGSATFSQSGYSVIAAVNGPVEVQRRDELPEEAAIEVNVRPTSGVGSPKERHLESIIHNTLRPVILTRNHPRTLIQVTLQILSVPEDETLLPPSSHLSVLAPLLQASLLALLSASIPLSMTFSAASVAVSDSNQALLSPSPRDLLSATSAHVFAFSSLGDLLVAESEGTFEVEEWELAREAARKACCKPDANAMVEDAQGSSLPDHVAGVVEGKVEERRQWKVAG